MKPLSRRLTLSLALAALTAASLPSIRPSAAAEDYPTRPVTLVVPAAAGGTTDIVARLIAEGMTKELGQQFLVDNKDGASGNIGIRIGARRDRLWPISQTAGRGRATIRATSLSDPPLPGVRAPGSFLPCRAPQGLIERPIGTELRSAEGMPDVAARHHDPLAMLPLQPAFGWRWSAPSTVSAMLSGSATWR
jgi:hypothetical protein